MLREKKRRLAARGFDQPGFEIEGGKRGPKLVLEVAAQLLTSLGVLAFRLVGYPSAELFHELAGVNQVLGAGDGIGAGHCCPFGSRVPEHPVARETAPPPEAARSSGNLSCQRAQA